MSNKLQWVKFSNGHDPELVVEWYGFCGWRLIIGKYNNINAMIIRTSVWLYIRFTLPVLDLSASMHESNIKHLELLQLATCIIFNV